MGFYEAKPLERAAAYVAHRPVKVWCAPNRKTWEDFTTAKVGQVVNGLSDQATNEMWINDNSCAAMSTAARRPLATITFGSLGPSIEVLTHEAVHLRGISDEGATDCEAMHQTPGVAVRFFHVLPGKNLRSLMAQTWAWHRTASAELTSVC